VDEQQALRQQYKIENAPTLVVLRNGEEVRREVGELKEPELRQLLREYGIFRQSDELREQAREKHLAGDTQSAILLLTQAIQSDPSNTRVAMDMVQIFLDMGELEQAEGLFSRLPDRERDSDVGKSLNSQLHFARLAAETDGIEALRQRIADDADDNDARFGLALCLVAGHLVDQAMEQLFRIVEMDAGFRDGAAREMIGLLSNMLAVNDPEAGNGYRRRLANMLTDG
jgi:putative thioredoxin